MISFFKKHAPKPSPTIIGLMVLIVLHSQSMYLVNLKSFDLIVKQDLALTLLGSLTAFVFFYLGVFSFNLLRLGVKTLSTSLKLTQGAK